MAHFAQLDANNIVTNVIVLDNAYETMGQEYINTKLGLSGTWIQTSYSGAFRKQFAGIGYTYDPVADVFVAPQPYPSWTLDSNHDWQPPTPMPTDGRLYTWDESTLTWKVI